MSPVLWEQASPRETLPGGDMEQGRPVNQLVCGRPRRRLREWFGADFRVWGSRPEYGSDTGRPSDRPCTVPRWRGYGGLIETWWVRPLYQSLS